MSGFDRKRGYADKNGKLGKVFVYNKETSLIYDRKSTVFVNIK